MNQSDVELLRRGPLFAGLSEKSLEKLIQGATVKAYAKGKMLFQQGDPAAHFYILLNGRVKLFRLTPDGDEAILGLFSQGDCLAEVFLFMSERYPASAEVLEAVRLLQVPSEPFKQRVCNEPAIMSNFLAALSLHLHNLTIQVQQLQVRTSTQRVADFLLKLCPVREGAAVVALPYDKSLIATQLGMKPESFSRALAKLRILGVHTERHKVSLSDVAALHSFCESGASCPPLPVSVPISAIGAGSRVRTPATNIEARRSAVGGSI